MSNRSSTALCVEIVDIVGGVVLQVISISSPKLFFTPLMAFTSGIWILPGPGEQENIILGALEESLKLLVLD